MSTQIKARIRLENGHLLSRANMHRIIARKTVPTDRWGNTLDQNGKSPIDKLRHEPPYFQRWAIKKEKKGFIFLEVNSNGGISGYHKTVRALVISALHCSNIVVEVEA